ncbi:Glycosyl hydrolases family 43 [Duganella sp. CF517]|uniref:family 43 glycosylhydrolase n=1 Tax=Duganella sp. CF517 TaxID=1881038 RepID=UPI0008C703E2|nr:family 43 glycosylhydrolase [Duganella sp. CF517]SEN09835.1 Glycosyl hydrolases family 43 [Duganella sp. CF517]
MTIKSRSITRGTAALCLAMLYGMAPAHAAPKTIQNDVFWKDTSNNPIYSQGGGILKVGSTYYWYGAKYDGAVTYAANPASKNSNTAFNAVTVYSSTDLATWKFEGNALSAAAGTTFDPSIWLGRLGVVYNSNTNKYVLLTQYGSSTLSGVLFATSDTPVGPFTYDHVQTYITNVSSNGTGDQTIFTDTDGASYLIFSNSGGRQRSYVAQIRASDSLNIEPATNVFLNSVGREGNAMFKNNGTYYFCASDLHGWNASQTYCRSANAINGPYTAEFVMSGSEADFSHVTQTGFFVQVNGSAATTVLYAGDRWSDFAGNGIGYNQWMPISFSGTTPRLNSLSQFSLDAATGAWSVGAGNNYSLNPGFEADRVPQTALAGWVNWTNLTDANPNSNVLGGHTGRWAAQHKHTAAYSASRYQNLSGLPDGTYTLKAWVKSSGGQSTAQVYVKNYGGAEIDYSVNTPIASWTQITIPNIAVTNGKATLGIYSVANANNWLLVDDVSFVKN